MYNDNEENEKPDEKENQNGSGGDKYDLFAKILCAIVILLIILIIVKLVGMSKRKAEESENTPNPTETVGVTTEEPTMIPRDTATPSPTPEPTPEPTPVPTAEPTPDRGKPIKDYVEAEIFSKADSYPFLNEKYEGSVTDIHYKTVPNMSVLGETDVIICATIDGIYSETEAKLKIVDTTAPVIKGVEERTIYVEYPYKYKNGVTVTDNSGETIEVEVDASGVNLYAVGDYEVIYTATDSSGNTARVVGKLHVTPNPGNATEEMANAKADEILAKILKKDMTDAEKCTAIYTYIKKNMGYFSEHYYTDEYKCAYFGMTQYYGDCYVYYCYAKVMLDRAGIENMKVTRTTTAHYWNLVKVNGEWYHFDTTPRSGGGEFCLLTDAELSAYSDAHDGTHVFDSSLYPERSETSLGIVPKTR